MVEKSDAGKCHIGIVGLSAAMSEAEKYEPLNILSDDPYRNGRGEKKTGHYHEQHSTEGNYQREHSVKMFIHILLGRMLYVYVIDQALSVLA
jgi:hypothetical protein